MAQEGRRSRHDERWRERNPVFENASQHNDQRHEKMAQEGRRKTIIDNLDEIYQVFENMRQHNELQQDLGGNLIWHASM
jgi:hypothetical protein